MSWVIIDQGIVWCQTEAGILSVVLAHRERISLTFNSHYKTCFNEMHLKMSSAKCSFADDCTQYSRVAYITQ